MAESTMQRSFAGGELAPALHARADQVKYITGLRTCRNFLVRREGGVSNRAGFRFIAACKTTSASVMLLRYVSEIAGESILIEAGVGYLRFFKNGAAVQVTGVAAWSAATNYVQGDLASRLGVNYYAVAASTNQQPPNATYWYAMPGSIYEVPSPYGANGLFNWVQSGTVITLTHPSEPIRELRYFGLTSWTIVLVSTAPAIAAPTGLNVVKGGAGTRSFTYLVTAAAAETYEESNASGTFNVTSAAEPTLAAPHAVTWTPVAGAVEYYVYLDPYGNGTFGFLGTATGAASFNDTGFIPDFAVTPPIPRALFNTPNNYPACAAYFQQRRFFAYTNTRPEGIWASRTGFPSNFGISSPLRDDDALTFRIQGNTHNPVRHLIGLKQLIVLTDAGEWTVGEPKIPLTPSNIPADQQTYAGVADKRPVVVGNAIIYLQARGSILRDLRFEQEVEGLAGRDLTMFAAHLVDGYTIARMDYQQTPHSIVWAVRSDGTLLGLTYIREQEIWGWHRHDTGAGGVFEDVCVVPEPIEDAVYVIVRRTINAATVRYIERLASRNIKTFNTDAFFVDAGLSYSGAPATAFSGLSHLEGQTVAVVADGHVIFNGDPAASNAASFRVTAGTITLAVAASNVHIGLPVRYAEIETLDLDVQGASIRDKRKRVGSVSLLIDKSARTFWAGPDATHLRQFTRQTWEASGDEHTGQVTISLTSSFNTEGRILIRQTDPLPLTILGVIPSLEVGG